ncbi:MAG: universal stress protein [Gammaproteobacteria bacterium]|nr:universal stress protein [Rhodocyclaceae bacterium]MBU3909074.1 universal stress protein [Gammaproteobacteria bacterium]MBU3990733.1 universal stress protein [Gammaproteobacteria bacterium]MBU4003285.1 universal stress protein [Gammaproteobacteria bacterium]MBU4022117.1 universal stress protein [Gammaproteobacteria bacterium]
MKTPPCILVTTDLLEATRPSVDRAFRLAAETGAQLTLMHVLRQRTTDELRKLLGKGATDVEAKLHAQAQDGLSKLAAELGQAHDVSANLHLASGKLLQSIIEHAGTIEADLLVFGSNGGDFLVSTTASRLLRMTTLPILVVKRPPHGAYHRVLAPLDFSPVSATSLRLARTLAPAAGITLLHAFESPFDCALRHAGIGDAVIQQLRGNAKLDAQQQLQAFAATVAGPTETQLLTSKCDVGQCVIDQEQAQDYDLIVMGRHGANMVEEFLLGSVTKRVIAESHCDVLVVA